eukprot:Rhum_TRINITY_DN11940_c0_g1::Rhum_TRINITY_DN11940_c0_g1_i1::g.48065::m.48065
MLKRVVTALCRVPVRKVNSLNFIAQKQSFLKAIEAGRFCAIDCEFTGLHGRKELFLKPEDCYRGLRQYAEQVCLVQVGISVFLDDAADVCRRGEVPQAETFQFSIAPPARPFTSTATSLRFLASHDFDFNEWIGCGIPLSSFAPLFHALLRRRIPVVGYHCLYDLLLCFESFPQPESSGGLPDTLRGFLVALQQQIPTLVDLRYMCKVGDVAWTPKDTGTVPSLAKLYRAACQERGLEDATEFGGSIGVHNAGFDAYLTGVCFAALFNQARESHASALNTLFVHGVPYAFSIERPSEFASYDCSVVLADCSFPDVYRPMPFERFGLRPSDLHWIDFPAVALLTFPTHTAHRDALVLCEKGAAQGLWKIAERQKDADTTSTTATTHRPLLTGDIAYRSLLSGFASTKSEEVAGEVKERPIETAPPPPPPSPPSQRRRQKLKRSSRRHHAKARRRLKANAGLFKKLQEEKAVLERQVEILDTGMKGFQRDNERLRQTLKAANSAAPKKEELRPDAVGPKTVAPPKRAKLPGDHVAIAASARMRNSTWVPSAESKPPKRRLETTRQQTSSVQAPPAAPVAAKGANHFVLSKPTPTVTFSETNKTWRISNFATPTCVVLLGNMDFSQPWHIEVTNSSNTNVFVPTLGAGLLQGCRKITVYAINVTCPDKLKTIGGFSGDNKLAVGIPRSIFQNAELSQLYFKKHFPHAELAYAVFPPSKTAKDATGPATLLAKLHPAFPL